MDYLKPSEAAKLLNVSYSTLKQWIYGGKIMSIKTAGGHHRIPRSEIEKLTGGAAAAEADQGRGAEPAAGHPPHILVAEDNTDSREFLEFYLKHWGYEVSTAATGLEAWNRAQETQFDLYLLDNWLPDTRGVELCRRIRERDPLTPIIFFSAIKTEEEKQAAIGAGAQDYLRKDQGFELLKERIDWWIQNPESDQEGGAGDHDSGG